MKVAQIMAGAAEGGAELFFERLCIALHEAGDEVLPVIRRNRARAETLRAAGMQPTQLPFGSVLDVLTKPRLALALRRFAPRVAVAWMSRANQHMPSRGWGGDWVTVGRLGGYYPLRHYQRCDHLVGNTHGIVDWLRRQGWAATRTHYLPNFVDDFAATAPAWRGELGVPAEAKLLLGLGRLHTDKGFDTLIRALPALPDTVLAIAGSGGERAALQALAAREGVASRVRFLGWRHDAGALLKAADVFVCSSRVEPLGNMVIEAWSAGCPLVAAAAMGPRELVRDGTDGLVVPMEDPAALAGAIARVLNSPGLVSSLGAEGRARYERDFGRAAVVAQWQHFLATVKR